MENERGRRAGEVEEAEMEGGREKEEGEEKEKGKREV